MDSQNEKTNPDETGAQDKPGQPEPDGQIHYHDRGGSCCGGGFHPVKFLIGFFLIFFGLIYLGKNLGFIPREFSVNLSRFWPLILIFIGFSFFTGRRWAVAIIIILFVLVIVGLFGALVAGGMIHPANFHMAPYYRGY